VNRPYGYTSEDINLLKEMIAILEALERVSSASNPLNAHGEMPLPAAKAQGRAAP
jgi:hypothetical protein